MKVAVVFEGESERFFEMDCPVIDDVGLPRPGDDIYVDDHICEVLRTRWTPGRFVYEPEIVVKITNRP